MTELQSLQDLARKRLAEWTKAYCEWLDMLEALPLTADQKSDLDNQRIRLLICDRDHMRACRILDAYDEPEADTEPNDITTHTA